MFAVDSFLRAVLVVNHSSALLSVVVCAIMVVAEDGGTGTLRDVFVALLVPTGPLTSTAAVDEDEQPMTKSTCHLLLSQLSCSTSTSKNGVC